MPYPKRANEPDRLRQLHELRIIDTPPDPVLDRICAFAQDLLNVPMVAVTFLDEETQWLKNRRGMEVDRTSRDVAFCNYTVLDDEVLVVPDATEDSRFADNPLVTGEFGLRFYAGVPLALEAGVPVATLCCLDKKPRRFSELHKKILSDLGAIALTQLRLHKRNLELDWASKHDGLTRLPNRRALHLALEAAADDASRRGHKLALMFIDVDRLKEVNDTRGHDAGDALLREVAARLRTHVPGSALAARIGGDEFAVLVPAVSGASEAEAIGQALVQALRMPLTLEGFMASCQSSMGISLFPDHADDVRHLLRAADIALYAAKDEGRARLTIFRPELKSRMLSRVATLARARDALLHDRIVPFYQPKIALSTGRVVGFEALLRVKGPAGIEPPSVIEDAFDDPSLAVEIGRVMLDRIVQDMRSWSDAALPFGNVALNIAQPEISAGLPSLILRRLSDEGLSPSRLHIEVTENVFLGKGMNAVLAVLQELRSGGVQVALDDFGTGFASLTHLRRSPVDWIKLDRAFISSVSKEREAEAIVDGVIGLARSLGLGVIAEGIETRAQLDFLDCRHCDVGQGYLFAKAMAASRVPHFLRNWPSKSRLRQVRDAGPILKAG